MVFFKVILACMLLSATQGCDLNENCVQVSENCRSQRCNKGYTCKMVITDCYEAPCTLYAFCVKDEKTLDCKNKECPINTIMEEVQCRSGTTCDPICRAITPNETINCDNLCCHEHYLCVSREIKKCAQAPCESPVYCAPPTTTTVTTPKETCATKNCRDGFKCIMKPCKRVYPPCDPEPTCIPVPTTTTPATITQNPKCVDLTQVEPKQCLKKCTSVCDRLL